MILIAILNAILAAGVIVIVVTPLVWAILTQRRDHAKVAATDGGTAPRPRQPAHVRGSQRRYKPVVGPA